MSPVTRDESPDNSDDPDDVALLEGFDLDEDDAAAIDAKIEEAPPNRFYCAGADRRGEDGWRLCNYRAPKRWDPPCPKCGRWYDCKRLKSAAATETKLQMTLADMDRVKPMEHHATGIPELDKVLGGGLVYRKVVLLAGKHGGGKTRLLLQLAAKFARPRRRVFFASGEDDRDSVIQFCHTLRLPPSPDVIIHGNSQGIIIDELIESLRYQHVKLLIVDSLQTVAHSGSRADFRTQEQVTKVTNFLGAFAKQSQIAVVLIGQLLADEEMLAGGGVLKHGVDLLVRLDPYPLVEEGAPVPGGENVRMLWVDGKSRQGGANVITYLEMAEEEGGILRPLPRRLLQKVTKLELIP